MFAAEWALRFGFRWRWERVISWFPCSHFECWGSLGWGGGSAHSVWSVFLRIKYRCISSPLFPSIHPSIHDSSSPFCRWVRVIVCMQTARQQADIQADRGTDRGTVREADRKEANDVRNDVCLIEYLISWSFSYGGQRCADQRWPAVSTLTDRLSYRPLTHPLTHTLAPSAARVGWISHASAA